MKTNILKATLGLLVVFSLQINAQNDPELNNKTVEKGYTKSIGEIRKSYTQLDERLYHKPYDNPAFKEFYLLDANSEQALISQEIYTHQQLNNRGLRESIQSKLFEVNLPNKGGKRYSFQDDNVIHAYFAVFNADPEGIKPYSFYVSGKTLLEAHRYGDITFEAKYDDAEFTKVVTEEGILQLLYSHRARVADMGLEVVRLDQMVYDKTPFNTIGAAFFGMLNNIEKFEKAGKYDSCKMSFRIATTMKEHFEKHPKKVQDDSYLFVLNKYEQIKQRVKGWDAHTAKGIDMPKTYNMAPATTQKALVDAKKQFEGAFKVDKLVFLEKDWKTFKSPNYPYEITHRSLLVGLLTNEGGVTYLRQYNLQQPGDGKKWQNQYRFTAPFDGTHNPRKISK